MSRPLSEDTQQFLAVPVGRAPSRRAARLARRSQQAGAWFVRLFWAVTGLWFAAAGADVGSTWRALQSPLLEEGNAVPAWLFGHLGFWAGVAVELPLFAAVPALVWFAGRHRTLRSGRFVLLGALAALTVLRLVVVGSNLALIAGS